MAPKLDKKMLEEAHCKDIAKKRAPKNMFFPRRPSLKNLVVEILSTPKVVVMNNKSF